MIVEWLQKRVTVGGCGMVEERSDGCGVVAQLLWSGVVEEWLWSCREEWLW